MDNFFPLLGVIIGVIATAGVNHVNRRHQYQKDAKKLKLEKMEELCIRFTKYYRESLMVLKAFRKLVDERNFNDYSTARDKFLQDHLDYYTIQVIISMYHPKLKSLFSDFIEKRRAIFDMESEYRALILEESGFDPYALNVKEFLSSFDQKWAGFHQSGDELLEKFFQCTEKYI